MMNNLDRLQQGEKIIIVTVKNNRYTTRDSCKYHGYEIDGTDTSLVHRLTDHNQDFHTLLTGDNVTIIRGGGEIVYQDK